MMLGLGLLLAAQVAAQRCVPPFDRPVHCPEKYMPAPQPPSKGDQESIASLLVMADIAERAEESERKRLDALRNLAKADASRIPEMLAQVDVLKDTVARTRFFYNKAIERTIAAYHLTPPRKDLASDARVPYHSTVVAWNPVYSEREYYDGTKWRRRTEEDRRLWQTSITVGGNTIKVGVPKSVTRPNGAIEIFKEAFASPDALASAILHETSHWVDASAVGGFRQDISPGPHFRIEERAYQHEAALARTLKKDDTFPASVGTQYGEQAKETEKHSLTWKQIYEEHKNWMDYDLPVRRRAYAPAESASPSPEDIRAQGELSFLISWSETAAPVLREGLRQREQDRAETDRLIRTGRWNALKMWSNTACGYLRGSLPSGDSEQQESWREMTKLQRKFLLEHFVVLPASEIQENLAAEGPRLDSCAREMIEMFLLAAGPVDVQTLVERLDYQRAGGDFGAALRRASKAISDGTVAVVKGIGAPFVAIADALADPDGPAGSPEPSRERRAPPETPHQGDRGSGQDMQLRGPAWGQLNRIRVGGW